MVLGSLTLSNLDLSSNIALEEVSIGNTFYAANYPKGCQISQIDLSSLTNLKRFDFRNGILQSIDVSHNTQLERLSVENTNIESLDVSMLPNLSVLNCRANGLESLDVTHNPNLTELRCGYNSLSDDDVDLSCLSNLEVLECAGNAFTRLDISKWYSKLYSLDCSNKQLYHLDISALQPDNPANNLICKNNHLTSLDLTGYSLRSNNGGYQATGNSAEIKPYSKVVDGQTIYFVYLNDETKGDNKSLSDMIHELEGEDVNDAARFDISSVTEWSSGCTQVDDILILDGASGSLTYVYDTHNNNSSNNSVYKYLETFTLTWDETEPEVLRGDANGDGVVNVLDIVCAANYVMHMSPEPFVFDNADVNSDGKVNITDVIGIANITLEE